MRKKIFAAFICATLFFSGCGAGKNEPATPADSQKNSPLENQTEGNKNETNATPIVSDLFTDRDYRTEYSADSSVEILLTGSSASCNSPYVTLDGSTVKITREGTYVLSGTLDDGMIIVDVDKNSKVQLILSGVSIHNEDSAALYVRSADKVFVTLADGTQNILSGGDSYIAIDENNIDSVIFSKDDLTLNGTGSLTIHAKAGHGIVSKNDLVVTGGTYVITAASHGLTGKDSIRIADGNFTITSGKDGLHADNTEDTEKGFLHIEDGSFMITADGDGMDASGSLTINGGDFTLSAGDLSTITSENKDANVASWPFGNRNSPETSSAGNTDTVSTKGIKSNGTLTVTAGNFHIDSADDALHSNSDLCIANGSFTLATGDDGIHADGALTIQDGTITITQSYEGLEGKSVEISGGNITLRSEDDGINAAGGRDGSGTLRGMDQFSSQEGVYILICGGQINIDANGDGIDSNGDLTVTGGTVYVDGPSNGGNGAIDKNGTALISGGTVIALGAAEMAETFDSSSTQGCILITTSSTHPAGTNIRLLDASGNPLVSYTSLKSFRSIVISDPSIVKGSSYTIETGEETTEVVMEETTYGTSQGMGGFHGGFNRPDKNDGRKPDREGFNDRDKKASPDGENPPALPDMGKEGFPDGENPPALPDMGKEGFPDGENPPALPDMGEEGFPDGENPPALPDMGEDFPDGDTPPDFTGTDSLL
ncbi:MAG: carbohydrate-binding domain-containing protein [Lachnospiraceae bacterium]|nr:carbohydrate-binding domain-containing protein [Lachnospiraceae bacterium]